jgi:hypothetical protein
MTTKLDLQKLAPTLTGKERAKLLISSWHEAITGKQLFSDSEKQALSRFEDREMSRECRYYMNLYKHGFFLFKEAIDSINLKMIAVSIELNHFRTAFGIDRVAKMAIRALEGVPKFISLEEFNKRREEELLDRVESVAYLAKEETNAILLANGTITEDEELSYHLDNLDREGAVEQLEKEFGSEWTKVFWEQVERIKQLVSEGKLVAAELPEHQQNLRGITLTGVTEGLTSKSWLEFEGRHDKNWQPYLAVEEEYAVAFTPDELGYADRPNHIPLELHMRQTATELCQKLSILNKQWTKDKTQLVIDDTDSPLVHKPPEMIRAMEGHLQMIEAYKAATKVLEQELEGLPLFDTKSWANITELWEQIDKFVDQHNEFIESFEQKESTMFCKAELVDKEQYLIKPKPPEQSLVDQLVKDIKELADQETNAY